ncbi:hypothetical protein ACFP81_09730 [Deinococcus lacus]|uniref:Uncharacterized protein n=1 Tax=Deinococcus lacus TaxID=392561 RepID=A0ABW1YE03_9DEIO
MRPSSSRRRLARLLARAGQWLGAVGMVLALLLPLGTWGLALTLQAPARAALTQASAELGALDRQMQSVMTALEPLDVLARPEALESVRALGQLTREVEASPWLRPC